MAKNLKLNIKNTQIAEAINLGGLKSKLAKKKAEETPSKQEAVSPVSSSKSTKGEGEEIVKEEAPRIRARSKSAFAEPQAESVLREDVESTGTEAEPSLAEKSSSLEEPFSSSEEVVKMKTSAEIRKEIFGEEALPSKEVESKREVSEREEIKTKGVSPLESKTQSQKEVPSTPVKEVKTEIPPISRPRQEKAISSTQPEPHVPQDRLGPTGRHIKDYLKTPKATPSHQPAPSTLKQQEQAPTAKGESTTLTAAEQEAKDKGKSKIKAKTDEETEEEANKKGVKAKFKEFRDVKPTRRSEPTRSFDARDRQGLRETEEEQQWRKRRAKTQRYQEEAAPIRPTTLAVRIPISIKDLASEMKLKSSQLIAKLFLQGIVVTLNDLLEDETTIQLLGHEFGCEISIDKTEEKRIQITDKSVKEELQQVPAEQLKTRPPVVAFMGHVDHGKTSLIDAIRKSNRAAGEAGAITQHIGAFRCHTAVGDITVLDTPGHEAFSAMRARGADVTDIVVLVVAGDEGLRQQSIEAIQHAKAAHVTIVVAINKADKPNFNVDTVYRQLADQDLLPEAWGGQTITVNCSAVTGQGIQTLLEMLALQAEISELKANPNDRARGSVLESEMHKGLGAVATVLVQNGTLRRGDALVFGQHWGRVKNMHNEFGQELEEATPSTPVEITGLSGLPEAGQQFIVVKNEKEARDIAEVRSEGVRQTGFLLQQKKKISMENLFQQASDSVKKTLNIILRADVQGSLEALRVALMKVHSDKIDLNVIFAGVGEISESDVQLAAASKAVIIGFHTQVESHAESLLKQFGIQIRLHNIIYHAIDDVKLLMAGMLDKVAQETEKGSALVKAVFKSSQTGLIAGCQVIEGTIHRNNYIRVKRGQNVVWKGTIASLKRVKEDVREVQKGFECGILLNNFSDIKEGDILEAYEITYISQEL